MEEVKHILTVTLNWKQQKHDFRLLSQHPENIFVGDSLLENTKIFHKHLETHSECLSV